MNKVNDVNKIFKYNEFGNAFGGTEIAVQGLLDNVDNELLSKVDIIVSRIPAGFKKGDKPVIFWVHDLHVDAKYLMDPEVVKEIDKIVFVSNWQRDLFINTFGQKNIPYSKCDVIKNSIDPIDVDLNKKWNSDFDKIKIAYTSTPNRGLDIASIAFDAIHKEYPETEFHVFSNFNLYDQPSRNNQYEKIYENLKNQDGVKYRSNVDHSVLIEELKDTHIWVLPSIHPETYCIALAEAMSAGCICVHSDYGALPETSRGITKMYPVREYDEHVSLFYVNLKDAIKLVTSYKKEVSNMTQLTKVVVDNYGNWDISKIKWTTLINSLINETKS